MHRSASIMRFVHDDDGATLMEYALVAALATVVALFAIFALKGGGR